MTMKYKVKKAFNKKYIIFNVCLILLSLILGFCIVYYGKDVSFIEDTTAFFSVIITLFGLGLTSAIFVSQTLDNAKFNQEKTKKANNLKSSLAKSLALMAILILVGVVLEFILTLITTNKYNFTNIIETLMYASFVYCIILQIDITGCFVNIMKLKQDKEKE